MRARSTAGPMAAATAATSSLVEVWPREKRRVPRASCGSVPVASRTWLGWATCGGAGGAGGALDALGVEQEQQGVALAAGEAEVGVGRKSLVGVSPEHSVGHGRAHGGDQLVAQGADLGGEPLPPLGGEDRGHREGGDGRHVEGAGTDVPLLAAAVQDGYGGLVAAEEQGTDAVGAADLVAADGHGGEAAVGEVDVELPEGLDGVGVQRDPVLAGDGGQFADRHDGADLVVGPHHGGQGHVVGVALDGLPEGLGVHTAVAVHGQVLDAGALVFGEPVDGVEHGVVLDGAGQDPGPGRVGVAPGPVEALHGEVVGLRAMRR